MSSRTLRTGLLGGVAAGVVAYLLGYLFTYALSITTVRDANLTQIAEAFGDGGAAWKMVGWVFYNAHGATTTLNVEIPIFGGTSAVNLISQSDALSVVLYVIPPALLIAAGLGVARLVGASEVTDVLGVGAGITLGYLVLAIAGTVLFTVRVGESTGEPTLITAIGLAGVVYPLVFGTIGAGIGTTLATRETRREATA